jgi:hypothetical protein
MTGKLSGFRIHERRHDKVKSGIYEIQCGTMERVQLYTSRPNKEEHPERLKEHTAWPRKLEGEMKSSVAKHLASDNPIATYMITFENL